MAPCLAPGVWKRPGAPCLPACPCLTYAHPHLLIFLEPSAAPCIRPYMKCVCCAMPNPAGTIWWRDGGANFTVPVPGSRAKKVEDKALGFDDELR